MGRWKREISALQSPLSALGAHLALTGPLRQAEKGYAALASDDPPRLFKQPFPGALQPAVISLTEASEGG